MKTVLFPIVAIALLASVFAYPSVVVLDDHSSVTSRYDGEERYVIYNPYVRNTNHRDDYEEGYDDGFDEGYDEGYDDGYDDGRDRNRRSGNDPYSRERYENCRPYRCQYEWFSDDYVGTNYYDNYYSYPRSYVVTSYAPHYYHPSGWYSYY